jgi:hypothetical protein
MKIVCPEFLLLPFLIIYLDHEEIPNGKSLIGDIMNLNDAIRVGLFLEYVRGGSPGSRVWGTRPGNRKMGRVALGKGLFGKINAARAINQKAMADRMIKKGKDLQNPILAKPDERQKRLGQAIEKGGYKLASRI